MQSTLNMHVPYPLPGESAHSHRERIVTYNLRSSFEIMIFALRKQMTGVSHVRKRDDCNAIIAPLCGMTEAEYLDRHTLNPIYRLFVKAPIQLCTERTLFNSSGNDRSSDRKFWCDVIMCPKCNSDTIEKFGLRYLHSIHYVLGIDLCPKHGTPLERMSNKTIMNWRMEGEPIIDRPSDALIAANMHPTIVRYREVCQRLLGKYRAREQKVVLSRLIVELKARGILISHRNGWGDVWWYLIDSLPPIWVDCYINNMHFIKRGYITVLVLCTIFGSVKEIMQVLCK